MCEEIFGPVLTMMPFDSEDEAIAIANDTPYGLAAYIQTGNMSEHVGGWTTAFGHGSGEWGTTRFWQSIWYYKQSGVGREGGFWGIEEFLEIKAISGIVGSH